MELYLFVAVAFIVGIYFHKFIMNSEQQALVQDLDIAKTIYQRKLEEIKTEYPKIIQKKNDELTKEYNSIVEEIEKQKKMLDLKIKDIPALSSYLASLAKIKDENNESLLLSKNAYKAYDIVTKVKDELFNLRKENTALKFKLITYESKFPFINSENLLLDPKSEYDIKEIFLKLQEKESELQNRESELRSLIINQQNTMQETNRLKSEAKHLKEIIETEEYWLNLKINEIPVLSTAVADISANQDQKISDWFLLRRYKSEKASDFIKAHKKEMRDLRIENKNLQYRILVYESIFPVLKEYDNEPISEKPDIPDYDDAKGDRAHYWVNPTEYKTLSVTERNQLALDRYWNRNKTHAEIGTDYEKSIGYWEYEKNGWDVTYFGIDKGLDDMGRDLICISPDKQTTHIVQCKCWSAKKEIHENHINQLFGTTVRYVMEHTGSRSITDFVKLLENGTIVPVFYTKTKLSETAKSFAESLGIVVHEEVEMKVYPMIKCNINRRTQEKIYHLPFDQQYDNIVIDPPEEFIALTVEEAEQAGFRRAHKWLG